MNAPAQPREEKVLNGLLLATMFISGIMLVREGPHYDNVIDGWPFFTSAFFAGTLIGFLCWTYTFGVTPALKISGPHRQPWLAAIVMGLVTTTAVSYINRTFAAPADRTITAAIESVDEGKASRWYVTVKMVDGGFERYLISPQVADELKNEKMVRIGVARGALGFDFMAKFDPARGG
jgi:hypothetical protein